MVDDWVQRPVLSSLLNVEINLPGGSGLGALDTSLHLIRIRCLLPLPLIVPKLKLITFKLEKKSVISFGEFEAMEPSCAHGCWSVC